MWIVTSLDNYKSYIVHLSKIGKKWEYSGVGFQVRVVLHKAYDSFEREVLYSVVTEFGVNMKLVVSTRAWLSETYLQVGRDKTSETRRWTVATALQFGLQCAMRNVQANQEGLKLNGERRVAVRIVGGG
jgi:hypothetical protein